MTAQDVQAAADEAKVSWPIARDAIYPGLTRVLRGKDGAPLTVSYGTSDNLDVLDQGHTGSQLRIAVYGPGAANVVGLSDQTDLFSPLCGHWGYQSADPRAASPGRCRPSFATRHLLPRPPCARVSR